MISKRVAAVGKNCVSCGSCVKVCPTQAIQVLFGIAAKVDEKLCVGCGKCAKECPAGIITIKEREVTK